jgi:dTDP-4-amino-4,6-dideoxygalactose transaminase
MQAAGLRPHKIEYAAEEVREVQEALTQIMGTGWLVLSKYTEGLEEAVADRLNRKHAVAVSSDSAAFEIMLRAVGVEGRDVLIQGNAFHSMLQAVRRAGGNPVFMDVDVERHVSPPVDGLEALLRRARDPVVVFMQVGGLMQTDVKDKLSLCKEFGAPVLEDFAHAMGSSYLGTKAGQLGDVAATSLYATKVLQCGNGGLVVTDDEHIAEKARALRNYGKYDDWQPVVAYEGGADWRMTEFQAAVALARVKQVDGDVHERQRVARLYDRLIPERLGPWVRPVPVHDGMASNYYKYLVLLDPAVDRSLFRQEMKQRGVPISQGTYEVPVYQHPATRHLFRSVRLPQAEEFCYHHCALPLHPRMEADEVDFVVDQIAEALRSRGEFAPFLNVEDDA